MPYVKNSTPSEKSAMKMQIEKDMTGLQKLPSKVQKEMGYTKNPDGSAITMKSSPYMLYGKETSPMTMKGGSPLAKYGCTTK